MAATPQAKAAALVRQLWMRWSRRVALSYCSSAPTPSAAQARAAERDGAIAQVGARRCESHVGQLEDEVEEDGVKHGCMLLPLADAISLACYLMMVPDDGVKGKRALNTLDDRSRHILDKRWLSEDKSTLSELAQQYNVSAERIRQLENNAIKKLRNVIYA